MTKRFYAEKNYWYDLDTGEIDGKPGTFHKVPARKQSFTVWRDIPAYKSPINGRVIEGRRARREDLKRSGCREVDPSEIRHGYSEEFAKKKGLPMPEREFKHLYR